MRGLAFVLLLNACSQEPAAPKSEPVVYANGRDRLCVDGAKAGFIVYGSADSNCSARGRIERSQAAASFIPAGDLDCKIALNFKDDQVTFSPATPSCAFYCGPGAGFDGKRLPKAASASPAVDFAGDPLC
jgi:hypothetical protein